MGLLQDWCCGDFKKAAKASEDSLAVQKKASAEKDVKIITLDRQLNSTTAALDETKKELTDRLNSLIEDNTKKENELQELRNLNNSIFDKPCPAILQEVPEANVILGNFVITTGLGQIIANYPCRPAIFMPCPFFERVLDFADCNRPRPDLASIEICSKISNVFQTSDHYATDETLWKRPDNWEPAIFPKLIGKANCESSGYAIASACHYHEIKFGAFKDKTVMAGFGHLYDYGHGFTLVLDNKSTDMNDSYIIEATLEYAARAMTLAEAQARYKVDWGIIGYVRRDFKAGTYWFKPDHSWWGGTGQRVVGAAEGMVQKVKRTILRQKHPKKIKHEMIQEIWQDKRMS